MKLIMLLTCLTCSYQSLALTVIHDAKIDGQKVVSAQNYLRFNPVPESTDKMILPKQQIPGLPVTSNLKEGLFDSYKLSACQKYPTSFFVVGPDSQSMEWLNIHGNHLKEIHALGFITNIDSEQALKKMNAMSPIALFPSHIDGLAEAVQAPAYPFLTNGCEVWQ